MLKVVITMTTMKPASPAAWSSSSRISLGGGGGDVVLAVGGGAGGDSGERLHTVAVSVPKEHLLKPLA